MAQWGRQGSPPFSETWYSRVVVVVMAGETSADPPNLAAPVRALLQALDIKHPQL
jgi:hypothetical protein